MGGAVVPGPPLKIGAPHFTFGPPVATYIQYCIFKMWPPLLFFGPSGFLPPLLLNPGDGPALTWYQLTLWRPLNLNLNYHFNLLALWVPNFSHKKCTLDLCWYLSVCLTFFQTIALTFFLTTLVNISWPFLFCFYIFIVRNRYLLNRLQEIGIF